MPATYKLTYFDLRGRAEMIRIIFVAAGVEFEDNRISGADWGPLKSTSPWGSLPLLEIGDSKVLAESRTIARYLAKQFNLTGGNEWEAAKCNECVDAYNDVMNDWVTLTWGMNSADKKAELKTKFVTITCPNFFTKLEAILKQNGSNGHLVGKTLTWADIAISSGLESLEQTVDPQLLAAFPEVRKMREVMENDPKIKAYLSKRPAEDLVAFIKKMTS